MTDAQLFELLMPGLRAMVARLDIDDAIARIQVENAAAGWLHAWLPHHHADYRARFLPDLMAMLDSAYTAPL